MAWWVLTYLDNDRAQTSLSVLAETNHPAHLFMAWATVKPARRPIYRIIRGKRVFCGYKYIWNTPNLVEQTQTLDTFQHIFVTTPLQAHDHVWYYLFSTKKLFERYCQSALFHVWPPEIQMASARIYRSTDQLIPKNIATELIFDAAIWDDYNFWDPANPTRLTAPAGALYSMGAHALLATWNPTGASFRIMLNGAAVLVVHTHRNDVLGFSGTAFSLTTLMRLQPSDFIEVQIFHTCAIDRDIIAGPPNSPIFWIHLVGAYPI